MKAVKITNALWLGQIAPKIAEFHKRTAVEGTTYEGLYYYLIRQIQLGGDISEVWIAQNADEPYAWAQWHVQDAPHVSKVHISLLHAWGKSKQATKALLEEFVNFGKRHRAVYYSADVLDETIYRWFRKIVGEMGYTLKKTHYTVITRI